jgi:hypothetical protein
MDAFQGELAKDLLDLAGGNVRFIQKRTRLQRMTGTEWSLEI